jgi:hypothetical protein
MDKVYGDHVHHNPGTHLNGGIADDSLWQEHWQQLVSFPSLLITIKMCLPVPLENGSSTRSLKSRRESPLANGIPSASSFFKSSFCKGTMM